MVQYRHFDMIALTQTVIFWYPGKIILDSYSIHAIQGINHVNSRSGPFYLFQAAGRCRDSSTF